MKTTLFLSVAIDEFSADKEGIRFFSEGAWQDLVFVGKRSQQRQCGAEFLRAIEE